MAAEDLNTTTPRPFHNPMADKVLDEGCPAEHPTKEPLMNIAVYTHRLHESTRRQRSDAVGAPSAYDGRHPNLDVHVHAGEGRRTILAPGNFLAYCCSLPLPTISCMFCLEIMYTMMSFVYSMSGERS